MRSEEEKANRNLRSNVSVGLHLHRCEFLFRDVRKFVQWAYLFFSKVKFLYFKNCIAIIQEFPLLSITRSISNIYCSLITFQEFKVVPEKMFNYNSSLKLQEIDCLYYIVKTMIESQCFTSFRVVSQFCNKTISCAKP